MKNFKKTLALVLAAAMTVTTVAVASPAEAQAASKTLKVTLSTKATTKKLTIKGGKQKVTIKSFVGKKAVKATSVKYTLNAKAKKIVSVSKKGVITSKKKGSGVITLSYKSGKTTYKAKVNVTVKAAAVTKLTVKNKSTNKAVSSAKVKVGKKLTLLTTVKPANSLQKVKFSSSNKAVATVSSKGVVKGVKAGTATITIKAGEKTKKVKITVPKVAVTGIKLNKTNLSVAEGAKVRVKAVVSPSNATDKTTTWTSSDTSIATVGPANGNKVIGEIVGVKAGTVTITAKAGSKTVSTTVTVTEKGAATTEVESVSLKDALGAAISTAAIDINQTIYVTADVLPLTATNRTVTWSSSNSGVASVKANASYDSIGEITGVAEGTATITATAGGKSATLNVTVNGKKIEVESISVNPSEVTVGVGLTTKVTATVVPAEAASTVAWVSNDTSVATVQNGEITGVAEGTTTVTATAGGKVAVVNVSVEATSKPVQEGTQNTLEVKKDNVESIRTELPGGVVIDVTPEQIEKDSSTIKELTNQKWDNDVLYDILSSFETKDEDGNAKFVSVADLAEITNSGDVQSNVTETVIDDFPDMDIEGFWTRHTKSVEVTDAGLDITYKAKTHENFSDNWDTPIFVVYTADAPFDGLDENDDKLDDNAFNENAGYAEYFVGRADVYGWAGSAALGIAEMPDAEKVYPADWAQWVTDFKEGKSGSLKARYDGDKLVITFVNNGITSTSYVQVDTTKPVYISLLGEQCEITDIKAVQRTYDKTVTTATTTKNIEYLVNGQKYNAVITKAENGSLSIDVTGAKEMTIRDLNVKAETGSETEHELTFTLNGEGVTAVVAKNAKLFDLVIEKYGMSAKILHLVNGDDAYTIEGNQEALDAIGLGGVLSSLEAVAKK